MSTLEIEIKSEALAFMARDTQMSDSSKNQRITLADIGKSCGYHGTTVGLALKNSPRLPLKTRKKIQKVAREMGYYPDPALASLVAYRHQKLKPKFHSRIALITDLPAPNAFLGESGYGKTVIEGIRSRASELGYEIDVFCVGLNREHEKRVERILLARGISALIILGLERPGIPIDFNWEHFSVLSIGYSYPSPFIAKVSTKNRWASFRCVQELHQNGYRKPAIILPKVTDDRIDYGWSAGFLSACFKFGIPVDGNIFLPPLLSEPHFQDILDFLDSFKPDSIITSGSHLYPVLCENGFQIPRKVPFLCLDVPEEDEVLTGTSQNAFQVGHQAVNLLSNLQIKNIKGLVSHEFIHLVSGTWMPGKTLIPRNEISL